MNYSDIEDRFYSEEELIRILNISPELVDLLIESYMVIGCRRGNETLFPAICLFNKKLNARVSSLVQHFVGSPLEGWEIYRWMTEPNDLLDGLTPYEYIMLYNIDDKIELIASMESSLYSI